MNPGPGGFPDGRGFIGLDVGQVVITLLVLGGIVLFGVLVLRQLGAIERAVRGGGAMTVVPASQQQGGWQQESTVQQVSDPRPDAQQAPTTPLSPQAAPPASGAATV